MTLRSGTLLSTETEPPAASLPPVDDPRYFPAAFVEHLTSTYHGTGIDMKLYHDYMFREIQRGREIVRVINERSQIAGKDVLDVGCGYGGLLIVMKEAGARSLTGIEVDQYRLEWSPKRLDSLGYQAKIMELDVCRPEAPEKLGMFDVILAQDVIEHVPDPRTTIRHLCQMLRPGGAIYVQVGNKFSPDQLVADHHYRLPGITMLSRAQAIEYFCQRKHLTENLYGVGYWREEKYYRNVFRRQGVPLERVDKYPTPDHVLWYANAINEMCIQLKQDLWPDLRPELGQRMKKRMTKIAQLYVHASRQLQEIAAKQPELLEAACDAIAGRILTGVLRFVGKRAGRNGGGAA
ncbi:MAG TPA: methyltransferase domain-containing protein [Patescibacteria group bacterium]|nr:methyltransferase domain-containing protein [Patescibacteria group bacterium]